MRKKKAGLAVAAAAALAAALVVALLTLSGRDGRNRAWQMEKVRGEFVAKMPGKGKWIAPPSRRPEVVKRVKAANRRSAIEETFDDMTAEEERLVDTIHDALNDEDQELAIELAKQAVKSRNPEVRSEMVDTLRWFGDKVMPELLMFIDDPDEGVRMDATAAYQQAIYDIEDDREKALVIEISMRNLNDADALEEIASELIGMDDLLAVQALVNVIGGESKAGRRVAMETYETVTGEEYTTFEAADAWIREQQSDE